MVDLPLGSDGSRSSRRVAAHSLTDLPNQRRIPLVKPIFGVYAVAAILVAILPVIYDIVIRASLGTAAYQVQHSAHIGLNILVNVLCLIALLRTNGDLRRRFEAAMVAVMVNFGLLFLVITLFRIYYSRPVLIVSFLASIALVTIVNLLLEKHRERRIGLIPQDLDDETLQRIEPGATFIPSPSENAKNYDVILVDWARMNDPKWMQFVTRAALTGCEIRHIASYYESKHGRVLAEYFETDHAVSMANSRYLNWYKRAIDIGLVIITLPIALFILAVAALLILVTMGRPILFTQSRLGINGRPFKMYKLRTMVADTRASGANATAIGDPRITPLGRFLRRFRIDEIPQFYNILIGDMSLVGPRPEQPELARAYTEIMPAFQCRTLLRPGITGWAQVRGTYAADEKETENKLSYDLYYLKHASFMTDLSIVFQTCRTLVTGNSAR